ncbi:MAG: LutC/YkgG family protein [Fluviibacter sp.]
MSHLSARERILGKLREAQATPLACPDAAALYQPNTEELATRVERLMLNMKNAMAEVHRCTEAGLGECLSRICAEKQIGLLAVGPEFLANSSLCAELNQQTTLLKVTQCRADQPALFDTVDAGLTLTHGGIAETGTLVLWSGEQSPRLLSLVPPVHMAILHASRVVESLMDMMVREDWSAGLPTNVILISSPSKTADIQQTLAYGAHGPKQLVVVLVEDR